MGSGLSPGECRHQQGSKTHAHASLGIAPAGQARQAGWLVGLPRGQAILPSMRRPAPRHLLGHPHSSVHILCLRLCHIDQLLA